MDWIKRSLTQVWTSSYGHVGRVASVLAAYIGRWRMTDGICGGGYDEIGSQLWWWWVVIIGVQPLWTAWAIREEGGRGSYWDLSQLFVLRSCCAQESGQCAPGICTISSIFHTYTLFQVVHVQYLKDITATLLLLGLGFNPVWGTLGSEFLRTSIWRVVQGMAVMAPGLALLACPLKHWVNEVGSRRASEERLWSTTIWWKFCSKTTQLGHL